MTNDTKPPISPDATSLLVCDYCEQTKPACDVYREPPHALERDQRVKLVCQDCAEGAWEGFVEECYG